MDSSSPPLLTRIVFVSLGLSLETQQLTQTGVLVTKYITYFLLSKVEQLWGILLYPASIKNYIEGPMAMAAYVAEDGLFGHQWAKKPFTLRGFDALV